MKLKELLNDYLEEQKGIEPTSHQLRIVRRALSGDSDKEFSILYKKHKGNFDAAIGEFFKNRLRQVSRLKAS